MTPVPTAKSPSRRASFSVIQYSLANPSQTIDRVEQKTILQRSIFERTPGIFGGLFMPVRIASACAAALVAMTVAAPGWAAGPHEEPIRDFAKTAIDSWISDPFVIDAIREQNARHASLKQSDIDALDRQWRSETSAASHPLIDRVLGNRLSEHLMGLRNDQHGIVTEVFVMDSRGLNVGQSNVTSDYWQGDEAKWKETFLVGPGAMLIDDIELDESTQTFQSQVSMSIVDPATGEVIGAITVGIDVEAII